MDTYVIILSQTFPVKHPRRGEPTGFVDKIREALNYVKYFGIEGMQPTKRAKIHTMRTNWNLWSKRFRKIYEGKACLSLRVWSGKPYHSKQIEIARLTKEDGIGLQPVFVEDIQNLGGCDMEMSLRVVGGHDSNCCINEYGQIQDPVVDGKTMAMNDGLSLRDWVPFFRGHDLSKPLAIIHFTKFRY